MKYQHDVKFSDSYSRARGSEFVENKLDRALGFALNDKIRSALVNSGKLAVDWSGGTREISAKAFLESLTVEDHASLRAESLVQDCLDAGIITKLESGYYLAAAKQHYEVTQSILIAVKNGGAKTRWMDLMQEIKARKATEQAKRKELMLAIEALSASESATAQMDAAWLEVGPIVPRDARNVRQV